MRVGIGYDVHRLVEGRNLILGGINIPYVKGLLGHSDADVLVHSIMDSLLGALALGDIGSNFPDTDPQYEGACSIELLEKVGEMIAAEGYAIYNVDSIIIAQEPKLSPYILDMRKLVSKALKLQVNQVSIKATTTEKLGFEGEGSGISSQAICLLVEKSL